MASPLYYLPGRKQASPEAIRAAGLGYLLDGAGGLPSAEVPHSGPDGKGGCMAALVPHGAGEVAISALVRGLTWAQLPGSQAWLGWRAEDPPGPTELARREQVDGHEVELGDDRRWLVPVARCLDGGTRLPRRLAWDGAEWSAGEVLERYRALWEASGRIWDAIRDAAGGAADDVSDAAVAARPTFTEECNVACAALAVNYRLGAGEVSLLGLFEERAEIRAIKALIDWPTLAEVKKKLAAAPASSAPGAAD